MKTAVIYAATLAFIAVMVIMTGNGGWSWYILIGLLFNLIS